MSGTQTVRANNQHLQAGVNRLPANGVAVPANFTKYAVGIDLAGWAAMDVFSLSILFKADDSSLWSDAIAGVSGQGMRGGSWTDTRSGTISTVHTVQGDFPVELLGAPFLAQFVITAPRNGNVDALIVLS